MRSEAGPEVIAAGRARWDEVKAASSGPELAVKLSQAISRYIDSTVIASYGAVAAASDGGATSRIDILDSEALRSQQVVAGATTALEARIMAAGDSIARIRAGATSGVRAHGSGSGGGLR